MKCFAASICFSAIACSILELLVPSGKIEKTVRFVFGAFMVCALIIPICNIAGKIDLNFKKYGELKVENKFKRKVDKQMKKAVNEKVESLIKESLKEKGIEIIKVEVFTDTNEDNSISINKVRIYIKKGDEIVSKQIKKQVEKKLGIKAEVVMGSE